MDMDNEKKEAKKTGIKAALILSSVYCLAVLIGAQFIIYVYFAFCGLPLVFALIYGLVYSFCYALKTDVLKFITPDTIYNAYDNPIDSLFRSEFSKKVGSVILPALCFFPTLLFYFLFSWAFILAKR